VGHDLVTLPVSRPVVALTFDAGASDEGVAPILATLRREGVPASFFLTGDFVDDFPASARAMAAFGPVGNHTYHHRDLTTLTDAQVRIEVRSAASRIRTVTGHDPQPLFRFPFGAVDAHRIAVVNSECYVPFRWSVDTLGWKGTSGGQSADSVVSRVVSNARAGEIVLMHVGAHPTDHSTLDADALGRVITELRARGYTFTTLASITR
jgi:peptidoglycan-N-acetylglucosamine deacetylase